MVVWKKILGGVIALGLTTNLALAEENQVPEVCFEARALEEKLKKEGEDQELAILIQEKASECLNQFNKKPPQLYAKLQLKENFGLDENSSVKEYKKAIKIIKSAAKIRTGTTAIYVPGFGSVPASTMIVKTGASSSGNPEAQYLLGYIYLNGLGGKLSESKAKKYLKRSASQGHFQAQGMLEEIETNEGN